MDRVGAGAFEAQHLHRGRNVQHEKDPRCRATGLMSFHSWMLRRTAVLAQLFQIRDQLVDVTLAAIQHGADFGALGQ